MDKKEAFGLYMSIQLQTYICSACGKIVWPALQFDEDGQVKTDFYSIIDHMFFNKLCNDCAQAQKEVSVNEHQDNQRP